MPTPPVQVLEKALALLAAIEDDRGKSSLTVLAARAGVPHATAHRIATTFERHRFLARVGRGRYALGATLIAMADTHALHRLIAALGAPIVRALAQRTGLAAHLGVFEGDMVTYLIKAGRDSARIFTKEGMQLEAYCSGIGKVLLAHLPAAERRRYLATGPFIELTPNTITDPRALASALDDVRARGFACDNCEIDLNLRCIAAPVRNAASEVVAAISVSSRAADQSIDGLQKMLPTLQAAAGELELALDPPPRQARHAG